MNRKVIKVISILLMILMVVTMLSTSVLAVNWDSIGTDSFDKVSDQSGAASSATSIIGAILNIVQVIGMGVAVIMLIVMAIKYISAAPSEKAEIKKGVTIYVVGAIVLFAASGILGIIRSFALNNVKEVTTEPKATVYVEMIDTDEMYLG